jgi:hypothetical protein
VPVNETFKQGEDEGQPEDGAQERVALEPGAAVGGGFSHGGARMRKLTTVSSGDEREVSFLNRRKLKKHKLLNHMRFLCLLRFIILSEISITGL